MVWPTVLDRICAVNCRVQLIGCVKCKALLVYRNQLKICYGDPVSKNAEKQSLPVQWNLPNAVTYGPDIIGLIREVAAIQMTSIKRS